jgi:hypothetical protein
LEQYVKVLNGKLQIVPHDNHNLLRRMRAFVEALVDTVAADPRFARPPMWLAHSAGRF